MTKQLNDQKKAGALYSALSIELHTVYAINTWTGRPRTESKREIIGFPLFFRFVSKIDIESRLDNPYADAKMLELETLINQAKEQIQRWVDEINILLTEIPTNISISVASSSQPLNIGVHSQTPIGYRCVYLLVGNDQLAAKLFQAHHYGLLSLTKRAEMLRNAGRLIRKILSSAQQYRAYPVSRSDIALKNKLAQQAIELFGEVDEAILLGKKRSAFSAPLNLSLDMQQRLSEHYSKKEAEKVIDEIDE